MRGTVAVGSNHIAGIINDIGRTVHVHFQSAVATDAVDGDIDTAARRS